MARDIEPQGFFFEGQLVLVVPEGNVGKGRGVEGLPLHLESIEEPHLGACLLLLDALTIIQGFFERIYHLGPMGAGRVECAALDEALHDAFVDPFQVDPFTEFKK